MKILGTIAALLTGAVLLYVTRDFPDWADPNAPASKHVSEYYITHAYEDTHAPNLVTAILADYRNFDTFLETTVVFTAGFAIILLLRLPRRRRRELAEHSGIHPVPRDLIVENSCRFMFPLIQLFALYVIAHGHHSPGGGFQGGVILGASYILIAIAFDLKTALERFSPNLHIAFAVAGVLLYLGVGITCMALGGNFLDYSVLSKILPVSPVDARSHGILIVEIGVAMTVMPIMFSIYTDLSSHGRHLKGL